MESSPNIFKKAYPNYIHTKHHFYDTDVEIPTLENVRYISLDTFSKVMQNKDIDTDLEAWLTFLSCTDETGINQLLMKYPEFADIYREIAQFRRRPAEVMTMFRDALATLDHNTELYMIDLKQKELDEAKAALLDKDAIIADKDATIADKDATIADKDAEIKKLKKLLASK